MTKSGITHRIGPISLKCADTDAACPGSGQERIGFCDGLKEISIGGIHEAGGPTLPTLDCEVQRIRPGWSGQRHRHTHAVVYHVVDGAGCTEIGDGLVEWERGDTFVVPLWTWHRHRNDRKEPAVLFSMTDRPVMQSLGFHREQVEGGSAVITR